jgi:excisionase family DNA binding protein
MAKATQTPPNIPTDIMTRKDVCHYLKITLPTVHAWAQRGIIKSYRLGNRVYFKRCEIVNALTFIHPKNSNGDTLHKGANRE